MKNIKEEILSAIVELDTDNPSDPDILRIALSAEQGAITLYNKLATLASDETIRKVLLDVSKEEKVHVHEFQELIRSFDNEEIDSEDEGIKEVNDMIEVKEEFQIPGTKVIVEKGDYLRYYGTNKGTEKALTEYLDDLMDELVASYDLTIK